MPYTSICNQFPRYVTINQSDSIRRKRKTKAICLFAGLTWGWEPHVARRPATAG